MPILHSRLFMLSIPFKMTFSHAGASRSACDSYILEISYGNNIGYGELLMRPYVNDPEALLASPEKISSRITYMLIELTDGNSVHLSIERLRQMVMHPKWEKQDLPLLAAVETAVLDLLCSQHDIDIYNLLELVPKRSELFYGGVLPILSEQALENILQIYHQILIPYIRIKLSGDYEYNSYVLKTARRSFGEGFDIRVDVNCGWDVETTLSHLTLLTSCGVKLVEEPIGADHEKMIILSGKTGDCGIIYVADESAVSFEDVENIIKDENFGMLNLRIAKNGGILRVLELADRAEHAGLKYQLGSHVGETGILSVIGRIAASLMENPVYIDGSFDDFILSDNITDESFTFGTGGKASIISGKHIGYTVDAKKLGNGTVLL